MYKIKLLFSISLAVIALSALSQNIQVTIIDKQTRQGIPFASIIYFDGDRQFGGYTDSLGIYSVKKLDAELQISCIGYETLKINRNSLIKDLTISLTPIQYNLNTVNIKVRKTKILRLGYFKDKDFDGPFGFGNYLGKNGGRTNYVAQFIANSKKDTSILITRLLYNLSNEIKAINNSNRTFTNYCTPTRLRVHLFTVNKETGAPDQELLTKNIIFKNNCDQNNLIIDIENENIYMPIDGVFVGLEYVDDLKTANMSYPFYIVFKTATNSCYYSYYQQNWTQKQYSYSHKIAARFGIEVNQIK